MTASSGRKARPAALKLLNGRAVMGDFSQCELVVRQVAVLAVDRGGELFKTNAVQLRYEGRFGVAVKRPSAFAQISLTAPPP